MVGGTEASAKFIPTCTTTEFTSPNMGPMCTMREINALPALTSSELEQHGLFGTLKILLLLAPRLAGLHVRESTIYAPKDL